MQYNLTEFSHGSGCGCKLSPKVLREILGDESDDISSFSQLIVGKETGDDAAVVDLDGNTAIVSTTDFFMPIVDDPYDFGAIAATNALSDIYAMGATPIVAIAILGWPIDKLPAGVASQVLKGGRMVCKEVGIPLAGGHSIDSPEPIFGLAVTGRVPISCVKKNMDGKSGDLIYLTKPLGIGIATTAQKKKLLEQDDLKVVVDSMLTLNWIGQKLGSLDYVHAVTDVTGFGLCGHLLEICDASNMSARIYMGKIPVFNFIHNYLSLGCIPGGTGKNWNAYGHRVSGEDMEAYKILADPQTSGGLLISIDPNKKESFERFMIDNKIEVRHIGELYDRRENSCVIKVQ